MGDMFAWGFWVSFGVLTIFAVFLIICAIEGIVKGIKLRRARRKKQ